jgi:hypothetical protein
VFIKLCIVRLLDILDLLDSVVIVDEISIVVVGWCIYHFLFGVHHQPCTPSRVLSCLLYVLLCEVLFYDVLSYSLLFF